MENLLHRIHDQVPTALHAGGEHLQRHGIAIAVDNQARQAVTFTMDHAICRPELVLICKRQHPLAPMLSFTQAIEKESVVYGHGLASEHAPENHRVRIQIAASQEFSASIMNIGKVPGFHLIGPVCHLVAIHPQVACQELGFFARKEPDTMDWFHGGTQVS